MDEFAAHLKIVQKVALFFLSVCFFAWALLPDYRAYVAGLILGTAVSLLNSKYLAWKIDQLGQAVTEKTNRKINLGFVTRAAMALTAVVISIKNEHIEFSTTLAGLFFVQLATLLLGIIYLYNSNKSDH
jgi:ATP synthase protein I